ncbi:MAG: hypothetical protein LQ342_005963 [Letrouitia transgressa]|nr:MAG: hypothetical protein LQ342_005963 [Letrouitia transgressa]
MPASIAFFGATGGSTLACLALALEAGHPCSALSRSSSKLRSLLLDRQIPESTLSAHLTITEGDIRDAAAVSRTLSSSSLIISGIGAYPKPRTNPLNPSFQDPIICQDAIATILSALRTASSPKKPLLVALSTTGISSRARDVPLVLVPLYAWFLHIPHADKKAMEVLLETERAKPEPERAIADFVIVRPSLLKDGKRLGAEKVRVGEEGEGIMAPAVGYTISREDVGGWVFENVVAKGEEEGRKRWGGKMVSLTY